MNTRGKGVPEPLRSVLPSYRLNCFIRLICVICVICVICGGIVCQQLDLKFADSYSQNFERAGLAQLVERAIRNRKVTGTTPVAGSM